MGKNSRTRSIDTMAEFSQEGNIFGICCSTGEFLLDFLMVIITVILCVTSFTNCYPSRHAAYDATLLEHRATASWSSRKWSTLYLYVIYSSKLYEKLILLLNFQYVTIVHYYFRQFSCQLHEIFRQKVEPHLS